MLKKILAVIAGIVTGMITVGIGDALAAALYPVAGSIDLNNKQALAAFVQSIPLPRLVIMFSFWILSSFFGGLVAVLIDNFDWKKKAIPVGAVLMAAAIANMFLIPHPLWMIIGAIALYIPAAFLGGSVALKMKPKD